MIANDGRELHERLQDIVTVRIQQMAQSHTEPDEQSVQGLANHFTAMKAVEWLINEYPGFFE